MKAAFTTERPVAIALFGSGTVGMVNGTCFAAAGRLQFTGDAAAAAIGAAEILFIAVGTPPDEDGYPRRAAGPRRGDPL